jgi:hypothetical protein
MKSTEPTRVIALFRHHAGLSETSQLPSGYSLERIIEAIVDHEERKRGNDGPHGESRSGA